MSGIFISYRRQDASGYAGRLYERLARHFGKTHVFMDIDTLQPGLDFGQALDQAVSSCEVLIALIGPTWLNAVDADGQRRLDNPDDFVRMEIATALARDGVRVVPVLVGTATMPKADALPADLKPLARRQSVEISDHRWDFDVARLIDRLEAVVPRAGRGATVRRALTIGTPLVLVLIAVALAFNLLGEREGSGSTPTEAVQAAASESSPPILTGSATAETTGTSDRAEASPPTASNSTESSPTPSILALAGIPATVSPTTAPTPSPTNTPTPEATSTSTPDPTSTPTPEPTSSPTPEPTPSPTREPTSTPRGDGASATEPQTDVLAWIDEYEALRDACDTFALADLLYEPGSDRWQAQLNNPYPCFYATASHFAIASEPEVRVAGDIATVSLRWTAEMINSTSGECTVYADRVVFSLTQASGVWRFEDIEVGRLDEKGFQNNTNQACSVLGTS